MDQRYVSPRKWMSLPAFFQVAIVVNRSAVGSIGVLQRSGITGGRVGRHANFSSGMGLSGCPMFSPYVK